MRRRCETSSVSTTYNIRVDMYINERGSTKIVGSVVAPPCYGTTTSCEGVKVSGYQVKPTWNKGLLRLRYEVRIVPLFLLGLGAFGLCVQRLPGNLEISLLNFTCARVYFL